MNIHINVHMSVHMYKRMYKLIIEYYVFKRTYKLMTKKIRRKRDKMCRDAFKIFEKRESTYLPSMIPEVFPYTSQFIQVQSLLRYPLVRTIEKKMYFAKKSNASYNVKKEYVSFNVLYTKETLFNIIYIHSMEHRAVHLLSRCYDLTAAG